MPKEKRQKTPRRTRDQYTVVLEDIRDKVSVVAEAVRPIPKMRDKLDATFEEVGALKEDVGELRLRMDAVEAGLKILGRDMETVKSELRLIRNDLKAKVERQEFEALEERVERLEAEVRAR